MRSKLYFKKLLFVYVVSPSNSVVPIKSNCESCKSEAT